MSPGRTEAEYVVLGDPESVATRGIADAVEASREFQSTWNDLCLVADEYREVDDERVVVLLHYSGHGSTSGIDLGQVGTEHANLFHIRDGKVTRYVVYWDLQSTPADLGLTPDTGT
jgi:ketosteroid isomerase-like protein